VHFCDGKHLAVPHVQPTRFTKAPSVYSQVVRAAARHILLAETQYYPVAHLAVPQVHPTLVAVDPVTTLQVATAAVKHSFAADKQNFPVVQTFVPQAQSVTVEAMAVVPSILAHAVLVEVVEQVLLDEVQYWSFGHFAVPHVHPIVLAVAPAVLPQTAIAEVRHSFDAERQN